MPVSSNRTNPNTGSSHGRHTHGIRGGNDWFRVMLHIVRKKRFAISLPILLHKLVHRKSSKIVTWRGVQTKNGCRSSTFSCHGEHIPSYARNGSHCKQRTSGSTRAIICKPWVVLSWQLPLSSNPWTLWCFSFSTSPRTLNLFAHPHY